MSYSFWRPPHLGARGRLPLCPPSYVTDQDYWSTEVFLMKMMRV